MSRPTRAACEAGSRPSDRPSMSSSHTTHTAHSHRRPSVRSSCALLARHPPLRVRLHLPDLFSPEAEQTACSQQSGTSPQLHGPTNSGRRPQLCSEKSSTTLCPATPAAAFLATDVKCPVHTRCSSTGRPVQQSEALSTLQVSARH